MGRQYKLLSKLYDLLDIIYFRRKATSPRTGVLEFIPNGDLNLLEVPVGTASNSVIIADQRPYVQLTGIDRSKEMLAIAGEKILKRGIGNIKLLAMDATNMEFADNTYDIVLISLLLHEVGESIRQKIMSEAKRVLKDDGKIIIVEWDKPEKTGRKILFAAIQWMEPSGFKEFLQLDFKQYALKFGLIVLREKKCDYTRLIEMAKAD